MDRHQAAQMLQEFQQHRTAGAGGTRSWKWKEGVILFPESFCMWCGQAMTSTRVWLTDERALKLLGQIKLEGGRLVKENYSHPHVHPTNGGAICMKDATSAYQALFLAWNTGSMHWAAIDPRKADQYAGRKSYFDICKMWRNWLADTWGHSCGAGTITGGLSAELGRSEVAVKAVAVQKAAVVAVDDTPIFGTPIFGIHTERPAVVLNDEPIFGTAARPRRRR